jgi:hypothetical protein
MTWQIAVTYLATADASRGFSLAEVDQILDSGVRVTYNGVKDTLRVFSRTGRSVVVDAQNVGRVVTVIP